MQRKQQIPHIVRRRNAVVVSSTPATKTKESDVNEEKKSSIKPVNPFPPPQPEHM